MHALTFLVTGGTFVVTGGPRIGKDPEIFVDPRSRDRHTRRTEKGDRLCEASVLVPIPVSLKLWHDGCDDGVIRSSRGGVLARTLP